jgi:hypothetical protein
MVQACLDVPSSLATLATDSRTMRNAAILIDVPEGRSRDPCSAAILIDLPGDRADASDGTSPDGMIA